MLYISAVGRHNNKEEVEMVLNFCKVISTMPICVLGIIVHASNAFSISHSDSKGSTGVRFSIYPSVPAEESLRETVKRAVKDVADLGLDVIPDDVSTSLLGPEPTLFEAVRLVFGRAALSTSTGKPRHVSMQCTFVVGCPGEIVQHPLPPRTILEEEGDDREFICGAYNLPPRIACHFSIYPLGSEYYMDTIQKAIDHAKKSPSYQHNHTHFSNMLDGEGNEVFDVLRSTFAIARENTEHVVMTATLTANKRRWLEEDQSPPTI